MDKFRLDLNKWQNMYPMENSKAMYNLLEAMMSSGFD